MAPNNDQGDSQNDSGASHSLDGMDQSDPPPPPNHISNTRNQDLLNNIQQVHWMDRNMDYLQSFDARSLHQLPLLSRLWGYDLYWYRQGIEFEVAELTSWAGRRLNPEEMSIFTSHAARGVVASSYDRPIAIGATTFALWRGWSSYRMPFYQPRFTRVMHPQATQRPFFTSLAWHSARTGVYGLLGLTAYKLLAQHYRTHMLNSFTQDALDFDPGLDGLVQDINVNLKRLDRERDLEHGETD